MKLEDIEFDLVTLDKDKTYCVTLDHSTLSSLCFDEKMRTKLFKTFEDKGINIIVIDRNFDIREATPEEQRKYK